LIHEFKLPDIGEGLSEAELLEWLVAVGDSISEGDDVAMISTDKVNVDLPSPRSGVVVELPWRVGDIIPVGAVFMRIEDANAATAEPTASQPAPTSTPPPGQPAPARAQQQAVKAAPALRRYAREQGVDLAQVTPSGPGGQLLRADVDAYLQQGAGDAGVERFRLSGARLTAAKRLAESSRTSATATQTFEVFADGILAAVSRVGAECGDSGPKMTPLPVIAKCVAEVLSRHAKFNATVDESGEGLLLHTQVNLGIAVDTEAGLVVPVVHDVGSMDIPALARAILAVAERARADALTLDDVRGATFTVSSTGGLERATMVATTPVINLPNIATLWVSRITDRPRVETGALRVGPVMACTLSFDHRFIDGAEGTAFINDLDDAFANV
jgi:pyruvate/2-oxoglutarate dehydrogenase complex dihydrolipoamide acyltransferase (E2) component